MTRMLCATATSGCRIVGEYPAYGTERPPADAVRLRAGSGDRRAGPRATRRRVEPAAYRQSTAFTATGVLPSVSRSPSGSTSTRVGASRRSRRPGHCGNTDASGASDPATVGCRAEASWSPARDHGGVHSPPGHLPTHRITPAAVGRAGDGTAGAGITH